MHIDKKYYQNGNIEQERYYENDKLHRLDKPAAIFYCENENIEEEYYYQNGKRHRLDGPVVIHYYENGDIEEEYYINNKKIDEFQYYVMTGSMK